MFQKGKVCKSGLLELRKGETIELPCNYKGNYKKEDYPDEIEITWKRWNNSNSYGITLEGSDVTILAEGDILHYDPLMMSQKVAPRKHTCVLPIKVACLV